MTAISLLVLRCADLPRTRALYEALGLTFRSEVHASGPEHFSAHAGHSVLELYPTSDSSTRGLRLGLTVSGLAERVSAAAAVGATLLQLDVTARPARALLGRGRSRLRTRSHAACNREQPREDAFRASRFEARRIREVSQRDLPRTFSHWVISRNFHRIHSPGSWHAPC